jgi:hypothetical protein
LNIAEKEAQPDAKRRPAMRSIGADAVVAGSMQGKCAMC